MAIVMVSSKEQIVLKLSEETATLCISRNYVGICILKIILFKIPATDSYNNLVQSLKFNKTLLDLTVYFLNIVKLQ